MAASLSAGGAQAHVTFDLDANAIGFQQGVAAAQASLKGMS